MVPGFEAGALGEVAVDDDVGDALGAVPAVSLYGVNSADAQS